MYNILKKHILRKEKHLLTVLNSAKRIRINEEYLNISYEEISKDKNNFYLPIDVVFLEFKKHILLLVDRFKNQVGYNKDRRIIILSKIKTYMSDDTDTNICFFKNIDGMDPQEACNGENMLSCLLGLQEHVEPNNILGNSIDIQKSKLLDFCVSNNTYLKWGIEACLVDNQYGVKLDHTFYIVSKKASIELDVLDLKHEYIMRYLYDLAASVMIVMYKSITYYNQSRTEVSNGKNKSRTDMEK